MAREKFASFSCAPKTSSAAIQRENQFAAGFGETQLEMYKWLPSPGAPCFPRLNGAPTPVAAKAGPMPTNHRFRLDDGKGS